MKYQIFAFSHAGGTVNFYKELESYLSDNIIFTPIEYPGHGLRMSEPLIHDIYGLLEDITNKIFENKQDIPFALMGYSLGSSICYYLYFKLLKEYNISPKNIFFMANTPPYSDDDEKIANLDDDKFLAKLEEYGGIPKEFLAYPDLVQFYLPILRTDVALSESCNAQIDKINSDMTIIYSEQDNDDGTIKDWDKCAGSKCSYHEFRGVHFFMNDNCAEVADIINSSLFDVV